jgi:multiple antibiotic resistance protein
MNFDWSFSFRDILTVTLILFAVIDILGTIPVLISLRARELRVNALSATVASGLIMITFLFLGERILRLIGLDVYSFAVAGSIVIFLIGLEMILGVTLFKSEPRSSATSIVPVAFPLIAGAGTLTTILSIRAEYHVQDIIVGIVINLVIVFVVLAITPWLSRKLGQGGSDILRRVFGIILLALAVKLFQTNIGLVA